MRQRFPGLIALLLGLLVSAPRVYAQAVPVLFELPTSTRAAALGNAFPLGSASPHSVFYHPGVNGRARGASAGFAWYDTNARMISAAGGTEWWSGGVVVGLRVLEFGAAPQTRAFESTLRNEGPGAVTEAALSVGYGREVFGIQWGATGTLVEYRSGAFRDGTAAVDVGAAVELGPVILAASIQNLGPDLTIGGSDLDLPIRGGVAVATEETPVGPLDLSGTGALVVDADGELIPSAGLEIGWWPVRGRTYLARVGYRRLPNDPEAVGLTLGGGFRGDQIRIDYAYEAFESGDGVHRFGVGFR